MKQETEKGAYWSDCESKEKDGEITIKCRKKSPAVRIKSGENKNR